MKVEEFRDVVHEDIKAAVEGSHLSAESEYLNYVTGILINGEEFDDFTECSYTGISRRNGNMQIDGFSKDMNDGSYCFFIVDYFGDGENDSVLSEDINAAFKKMRLFIEESIKYDFYHEIINNSQARDLARDLHYENETITKFRFYYITDAYNRQRAKTLKDEQIAGKTVELNIWDIGRTYELVCSKTQKESIEIVLSEFDCSGIPCVKAVDCNNVIADIESKETSDDEDGVGNKVSYTSYLAVVPGKLLCDLYLEYGAKLLEGNVRSFLSTRGNVNKSILATIKNYPDMFFAYNNGIAATATEIVTELGHDGLYISKIKDLQIVNGGQTTASIANAILTAKKGEIIDLDKVFVPMKISVLEHATAEKIIPKISEYSNSQNKVNASDFFSNHPFHIRMEGFSRKTPVPSVNGNQFQQYWFYERTRGQYNQGKMKFGAKSSQLKQYEAKYPIKQVITMIDLAKYMELYWSAPDLVGKGSQKMLQMFAEHIKKDWEKSDEKYNVFYYKRVIALAIIYNKADEIVKNSDWYKEKRSYKANVVAYTIALLFYHIHNDEKGFEMDFARIWNTQDIYPELAHQIEVLSKEVYQFITGPRETENVTEWCKRHECWEKAKGHVWTFQDGFIYSLVEKRHQEAEQKEAKKDQKFDNEMDMLTEIINRGTDFWRNVLEWGRKNRLLSEKEDSILRQVVNMNNTGRVPSESQAKIVMAARDRLVKEGMPMAF